MNPPPDPPVRHHSSTILRAAWIAPIATPAIRDGAIAFREGRVAAMGDVGAVRTACPFSEERDLGNAVLLPGLVNAHVHLELSDLEPRQPAGRLAGWLLDVMQRSPPLGPEGEPRVEAAVKRGVAQCLRYGTTTVGDTSLRSASTRRLLRDGPLRVVSFGEVMGMGQRRTLLESRLASAVDRSARSPFLEIGVSPHAPYSVEPEGYRSCLQAARTHHLPLSTHLAESLEEEEFLATHSGPLRELWERIGGWDDNIPRFAGGPIRLARQTGLLGYPASVLAHVNYCSDQELELLAAGGASVAYCPRTHAYFGHPRHRWREMTRRGINVVVGTDSCASSPDLNLVDDLRLLHELDSNVPPGELWEMATTRAAKALGFGASVGRLAIGASADCCVFEANSDDPLSEVLENHAAPLSVWIGGTEVGAKERMRGS